MTSYSYNIHTANMVTLSVVLVAACVPGVSNVWRKPCVCFFFFFVKSVNSLLPFDLHFVTCIMFSRLCRHDIQLLQDRYSEPGNSIWLQLCHAIWEVWLSSCLCHLLSTCYECGYSECSLLKFLIIYMSHYYCRPNCRLRAYCLTLGTPLSAQTGLYMGCLVTLWLKYQGLFPSS